MQTILFVSTRGQSKTINFTTPDWSTVKAEASKEGINFSNMKVKLVRSARRVYNSVLEEGSLLPAEEGNLIIQLVQEKMKGAYELDFTENEIQEMRYRELRITLKELRNQAMDNNDSELKEIIGNYTHDSVEDLKVRLTEAYNYITSEKADHQEDLSDIIEERLNQLEKRVIDLEKQVGLFNSDSISAIENDLI